MKRYTPIALVMVVSGLTLRANGDLPQILNDGTKSGGTGPRQFTYVVDAGDFPITELRIGTNDFTRGNYRNVLLPTWWVFETRSGGLNYGLGASAANGQISPGPCSTPFQARWYTTDPAQAIQSFTFGFDHDWAAGTSDGYYAAALNSRAAAAYQFQDDWNQPVGLGEGPIHGPARSGTPCTFNSQCGFGSYCDFPAGCCGGIGTCRPIPQVCTAEYLPVCGCNAPPTAMIAAAQAGQSVRYRAICQASPPPVNDSDEDGVKSGYDDCPRDADPAQADGDQDLVGDACDDCPNSIPLVTVDAKGCPPMIGPDHDRDGDVDQDDFGDFQVCASGSGLPHPLGCEYADYDDDGDADQSDFGVFQRCVSGPNIPADPGCMN